MARVATASVPGKVILIGEHAAVYDHPALVAAVDLRTEAEVEVEDQCAEGPPERGLRVELPDLEAVVDQPVDWILELRRRARARWRSFDAGDADFAPPATLLEPSSRRGDTAAVFVQLAVAEALSVARPEALPTVRRVLVRSAAPSGAGFGSSAAVATAVIAALIQALEERDGLAVRLQGAAREELVEALALQVERLQHGRPSGVDTAAVRRGGVQRMERSDGADGQPPGKLLASSLGVSSQVLAPFLLVHTGPAAEATGTVVDAVRRAREAEPTRVDELFAGIATCTDELDAALRSGAQSEVMAILRASQRLLEELGVVPAPIRELVRRLERSGAAAKISGAGSLAGPGAGALLVYDPGGALSRREFREAFADLEGLSVLRPRFGAPGLRASFASPESA